jgi:hypothetical protein
MSLYTVRVELHSATAANYSSLHTAMAASGLGTTIQGSDGRRYQLPTGTYFVNAVPTATLATVLAAAQAAAETTGCKYGVVVTEGGSTWSGLPLA